MKVNIYSFNNLNILRAELYVKTTLHIYNFKNIGEIYDNRPSSNILNKARTNTLQLNDGNRHTNKNNKFGDEEIYDNRPSSNILNKARTNTLQLNVRNRHTNKNK